MSDMMPKICGKSEIYVPDDDCSECMRELSAYKRVVSNEFNRVDGEITLINEELAEKLTKKNIKAGQNVIVTYDADGNVVVSSIGGGGGGDDITKENILAAMGYQELEVEMKATDGTFHKWRVMGANADSPTPPQPTGDVTKANILAAMGYTEFSIEMTDEDGVAGLWNIIGVQIV